MVYTSDMIPTLADCAYTAGLIDGEGSVFIARHRGNRQRVNGDAYVFTAYQPEVQVTTIDDEITPYLRRTWGGFIFIRPRHRQNPKWTDAKNWSMTGHANIIRFLEAIRPYLRLKAKKADLLLAFCRSRKEETDHRRRRGYSPAELRLVARLQPNLFVSP